MYKCGLSKMQKQDGKSSMKYVEKYGVSVWADLEMDELRKYNCLCLNCSKMGNCEQGSKLYDICCRYNLATMITRCPDWEKK